MSSTVSIIHSNATPQNKGDSAFFLNFKNPHYEAFWKVHRNKIKKKADVIRTWAVFASTKAAAHNTTGSSTDYN
jgi:hypothetical protein